MAKFKPSSLTGKVKGFFHALKTEQSTDTKMSTKEIWSYGLTDFGKSGTTNLPGNTSYINLFLVQALGMDVVAVGTLLTVSTIIGYIQGPFISLLEDSTKSKWGRFRPYLLISAPLTAIIGILFFINPFSNTSGLSSTLQTVWTYIMYILYGIINGFATTAWNGLTKCITHDSGERERAFSISKGMSIVSTTVPSWLPVFLDFGPRFGISKRLVFIILSVFMGVIGLLALFTAKNLKERVMIARAEKPWKNIGMVFKNKNKMLLWLQSIGSIFSYEVNMATPFVIMYCYGAYSLQTVLWGIAGLFAWASLFLSKQIYKRLSSKMIIYLYNLMTIAANMILLIFGYGTGVLPLVVLFATRCLAAVFEYINTVATNVVETDIWDHYEWKYGIRNESTTDLIGSWITAPISIINPLIYAWLFKAIQFVEGDPEDQLPITKDWLFYIYTIGTSISCFFTILPYFFIRLDKNQMNKIRQELEERRLAREGLSPAMELAMAAGGTVSGLSDETQDATVTDGDDVAYDE